MPKGEPIETRHIRPLDLTPEQSADQRAEKLAWVLQHYVRDKVKPEHQAEYARRYINRLLDHFPGVRELLVSDWVEEPGVRAALVGRWLEEVCEEIVRRAPSTESHSIVKLLEEIEQDMTDRS